MKCPVCGKKHKSRMSVLGTGYTIRCDCGTRLIIKEGFFKDEVVDWETIQEQSKK